MPKAPCDNFLCRTMPIPLQAHAMPLPTPSAFNCKDFNSWFDNNFNCISNHFCLMMWHSSCKKPTTYVITKRSCTLQWCHMSIMEIKIIGNSTVCSRLWSRKHQRNHQGSASLVYFERKSPFIGRFPAQSSTHWGGDEMAAIHQTTFLSTFSRI